MLGSFRTLPYFTFFSPSPFSYELFPLFYFLSLYLTCLTPLSVFIFQKNKAITTILVFNVVFAFAASFPGSEPRPSVRDPGKTMLCFRRQRHLCAAGG